jgi:hypothetical protein
MKQELFTTPILFMIFNRPDTTERLFQQIRAIKPKYLFVSADGPRLQKAGEAERCTQARAIIKQVDWDCEVKTKFSEKNQGCKIGVSSAITWFFENVEEGIILEDDCLPDSSFFHFCETLLEYYRNDERITQIGGVNFQDGKIRGDGSYYFSKINHIWGWATWRRAWKNYDVNIATYPQLLEQKLMLSIFPDSTMRKFLQRNFSMVFKKEKDTWDYQWHYAMLIQNGLAILPNVNLVSNIGFNENATHTIDNLHALANRPTATLEVIHHPTFMIPDSPADNYVVRKYMCPNKLIKGWQMIRRHLSPVG